MAEDLPFGSFAPSSPQDAVSALRRMHPDLARQIARYMAPGLYDYATEPEQPYDSRLRAAGGSIGPQGQINATGKIPGTDDPRAGPALADAFNLATSVMPMGGGAKVAMAAAPFAIGRGIRGFHGSPQTGLSVVRSLPEVRQFDNATSQLGAFFAPNARDANRYAGASGKIYSADLGLKNPYEMSASLSDGRTAP